MGQAYSHLHEMHMSIFSKSTLYNCGTVCDGTQTVSMKCISICTGSGFQIVLILCISER